jgi:hypothetical protein
MGRDCELVVSPLSHSPARGEPNLLRYFARLFPALLPYEAAPGGAAGQDIVLDGVAGLGWAAARARLPALRALAAGLKQVGEDGRYKISYFQSPYLAGEAPGASDLALLSAVRQLGLEVPAEVISLPPPTSRLQAQPWLDRLASRFGDGPSTDAPAKGRAAKSPGKDVKKSPVKEIKKEKKAAGKPVTTDNKEATSVASGGHLSKDGLFNFFSETGIAYTNVEHPEVFTVEAMMPYLDGVTGAICKNLFLKDKKKNLYLLSAAHDREVKLNDVAKKVGAKELRFGDESVMKEVLGVSQGCVTAFALVNDQAKQVKFVVDSALLDGSHTSLNFHPMVNTATTNISTADFTKLLATTGHTVLKF